MALQRIKASFIRWKKGLPWIFADRWQSACDRLWATFNKKPVSLESIEWMECRHARLMAISKRQIERLGGSL